VPEHLVLGRPLADEPESIAWTEYRDVEAPQEVRNRADVVFVTVREEQADDAKRLEGREIGMDDVDPEAPVVEGHATIDDERLSALLERQAVHPYFAEPSKGQKP
jgi:hypothetical protein